LGEKGGKEKKVQGKKTTMVSEGGLKTEKNCEAREMRKG